MPGPLLRFNTSSRSSSRQGQVPSSSPRLPPSPLPRFLPPSHYAAAAGISNLNYREDHSRKENEAPQAGPTSGVYESDSSNSSFEFKSNAGNQFTIASSQETPLSSNSKARRRSVVGDLPKVEASLVPSLRDTIDRMTRPHAVSQDPQVDELDESQLRSPTPSSQIRPLSRYAVSQNTYSPNPTGTDPGSYVYTPQPQPPFTPRTPKQTSLPKPALKTSLKSPRSVPKSPDPGYYPEVTRTPKRNVIDIEQGKVSSSSSRVPGPSSKRNRSATDPGTRPTDISKPFFNPPATPQLPSFNPPATPQAQTRSSIPRRVTPSPAPAPRHRAPCPQDASDSDEDYYSRQDKRKPLIVTNAVIVPSSSSSSSSSDVEPKTPKSFKGNIHAARVTDTNVKPRKEKENVNVGLGLDFPLRKRKDLSLHQEHHHEQRPRHADEQWVRFSRSDHRPPDGVSSLQPHETVDGDARLQEEYLQEEEYSILSRQTPRMPVPAPKSPKEQPHWSSMRRAHPMHLHNDEEEQDTYHPEIARQRSHNADASAPKSPEAAHWSSKRRVHPILSQPIQRDDEEKDPETARQHAQTTDSHRKKLLGIVQELRLSDHDEQRAEEEDDLVRYSPQNERATSRQDLRHDDLESQVRHSPHNGRTSSRQDHRHSHHQRGVSPSPAVYPTPEDETNTHQSRHRHSRLRSKQPSSSPHVDREVISAPVLPATRSRLPVPARSSDRTRDTGRRSRSQTAPTYEREPEPDPEPDVYLAESVTLARKSSLAAARERMEWGLPLSESDRVFCNADEQGQILEVGGVESQRSSVASAAYWGDHAADDESAFSVGAKDLFRRISGKDDRTSERRSVSRARISSPGTDVEHAAYKEEVISPSISADSVYGDHPDAASSALPYLSPEQQQQEPPRRPLSIPTSSLSPFFEAHASAELMDTQRRQVLQELCTTEEHFIARLEGTIRLYVLPLRVESTRTWITGVPPDFAKLLDWFEDIMHLHRFMVTSLRSRLVDHESRHGASFRGGDETVAELLGKFIHRLEVYQPYLVQLSGVVDLVGKMVDDGSNDLGQFIQMQQKAGGGGDELQQMLVEPVDMLSKYPDIFRRLLSCTSKDHVEYVATLCLSQSVETMIRAMTEVKIREDEYQYAKALLSHVQGIPPGAVVTRDRKLLLHGRMILVNPNHTPSTTPRSGGNRQTARTSRLMEALESLEQAGQRSADSELYEGATSYFPDGLTAAALTRSPNLSHVASRTVQAIVFSDVLVLVDVGAGDVGEGQLMQEIGLSRVLGVHNAATDVSCIAVDLLPGEELLNGPSQEGGAGVVRTIHLRPFPQDARTSPNKDAWIAALRKSSQNCIRTFCFSSLFPTSDPAAQVMGGEEYDAHEEALTSVLAAGLPFPKSPSMQVQHALVDRDSGPKKQEREARGWWDVRLRGVLGDMKRREELK